MLIGNEGLCVLHIAAVRDREALEALSRTARVIAAAGLDQVMLALSDGGEGGDGSWCAGVAAEIRSLGCSGLTAVGKMRALQSGLASIVREKALYAVHLHGAGACLLGPRALKGSALHARVLYSPHRRDFTSTWAATILGPFLQSQLAAFHYAPLASSLAEAQVLTKLLNRSAEVLPPTVSEAFFAAPRQEDARPTVLVHGMDPDAVDAATRLCVLLNGRDARVRFFWLGDALGRASGQLEAASVPMLDVADDGARLQWLSRAWAFMQLAQDDEASCAVAEAMAAGVPCLVTDIPPHRALINHGETGFVCTSERDFLEKLIFLLRQPEERRRLGEAARAEAGRRFTWRHYERAVLRAYGFFVGHAPPRTAETTSTDSACAGLQLESAAGKAISQRERAWK